MVDNGAGVGARLSLGDDVAEDELRDLIRKELEAEGLDADDYDDDDDAQTARAAARSPLVREQADHVAAAASPPTPRGSNMASTDGSSAGGDEETVVQRLCCVCMDKKIQVVVIPCGHACMCRKCSFRVTKCPVCRLDIQAQQRFYM